MDQNLDMNLSLIRANSGNSNLGEGISEEFDFGDKIKNLRNKKIKIKIRKDTKLSDLNLSQISSTSNLDQTDSLLSPTDLKQSIYPDAEPPNTGIQVQPVESTVKPNINRDRRSNNPLFWSTTTGVEKKTVVDSQIFETFNITQPKPLDESERLRARDDMKKEIAKLLFQKDTATEADQPVSTGPRRGEKKDNPMFYSTMPNVKKIEQAAVPREPTIFEEFLIPRTVSKMLEDENQNIAIVEQHIIGQKERVNYDLNQIVSDIQEVLHNQQHRVNAKLDGYLAVYKNNYKVIKERVVQFKEKAKLLYKENQDMMGNTHTQQTFNPMLRAVQFYKVQQERDSLYNSVSLIKKFKEEICNLQNSVASINREVNKRLLLFLADEMSKQTLHKPLYNNSETLQLSFAETRANIVKYIKEQFENFSEEMIFMQNPEIFADIFAFPKIEAQISEDNLSVVGDSEKLISLKLTLEKYVDIGNQDSLLSMHALPMDQVAIGSSEGFVRIFNYNTDSVTSTFQAQGGPVTVLKTMVAQLNDINDLVLLTGGAMPDCMVRVWQLSTLKCIRLLKGHKDSVTSLLPLRDGITLLSASRENEIYVWNLMTGKLFNKIAHHSASINSLHLLKDNMKFISASNDGSFCLWRIIYAYSNDYKRRMFYTCDLEKKFMDTCEIHCINSAGTDPNVVITGGSDNKIKIWNIEDDACFQEIDAHTNGIAEMMYFENPFKIEEQDNFAVLSLGYDDENIMLSRSRYEKGVTSAQDPTIKHEKGLITNHRMQIVRKKDSDTMRIVMIGQTPGRGVMVWGFE